MSSERLSLSVIPGAGWSADDIRSVARAADDAGFEAIFTTEVNNDAIATAQLMGSATERIRVGTWIANVYLRHSYTCAAGAALIAEATAGRFVLGLGVSHQPVNAALGITMERPLELLRRYVGEVRTWLAGEGPATHLPQRPAARAVPLYVAAMGREAVELSGEIADGAMPTFWSPQRVAQSKEWIAEGRSRSVGPGPFDLTLGIPTFLGSDLAGCRDAARQNLALYTGLPFFRRMWRSSGYVAEVEQMEAGDGAASLSDAMLDSFCLLGPVARCRERLAEYRSSGVDLPILGPPVGPGPARQVIDAFAA
ncbi:LLM class flavin-dependent oxidoreductase [Pseudonocardia dioxanivorans]|uniref:LLM class flavin-dependent oxidoreductase n=1 Tax=Pseudonocardia dioxanivorans TaxID=240495 RepID=UPI000CD089B6|nr:LLM class flavin-dependent oxidoreductase [Pseudonocardia dioxanivorans]